MYILELLYQSLIKVFQKKKSVQQNEVEECEHVFLAIDSTKKILACSKCGLLVKAEDLKQKPPANFFIGK